MSSDKNILSRSHNGIRRLLVSGAAGALVFASIGCGVAKKFNTPPPAPKTTESQQELSPYALALEGFAGHTASQAAGLLVKAQQAGYAEEVTRPSVAITAIDLHSPSGGNTTTYQIVANSKLKTIHFEAAYKDGDKHAGVSFNWRSSRPWSDRLNSNSTSATVADILPILNPIDPNLGLEVMDADYSYGNAAGSGETTVYYVTGVASNPNLHLGSETSANNHTSSSDVEIRDGFGPNEQGNLNKLVGDTNASFGLARKYLADYTS